MEIKLVCYISYIAAEENMWPNDCTQKLKSVKAQNNPWVLVQCPCDLN